jgi:energy-coupling factor transport system ATP-binding protein
VGGTAEEIEPFVPVEGRKVFLLLQTEGERKMLEMKDVSFNYGNGVPVLEHVNVQIGEGEFIGLGGRNGCGKTTVTRLLMGLEKPVSGEILHDGKVINDDDASVRSHFIGYVFQRPERQMFRPTVREEVAYGPQQLGMSRDEIRQAVDEALAATELTELAEAYPPNLNRGEKQRVAIASAIAMHTKYIVLDEPTSGQDSEDKDQLMALLTDLNKKGMTILIISHDMDIFAEYCQRVLVIGNHTKAFDGTPQELFTQRDDLYDLGLSRPDAVTLSMAVPDFPYCKSMKEFTTAMLERIGGTKK